VSFKDSPLLRGLAQAGIEFAREDLKERVAEVEQEPLGHLIKNILQRRKMIEAEGRKVTTGDVKAFLDDAPAIIQNARELRAEGNRDD
jgi:hypothetical protein